MRGKGMGKGRTLPPHTLMQFPRELHFVLVGLQEVDVDVEAAAAAVADGGGEFRVGSALLRGRGVEEGFAVGGFLAGDWVSEEDERVGRGESEDLLGQGLEAFVAREGRGEGVEGWIGHCCG